MIGLMITDSTETELCLHTIRVSQFINHVAF